MLPGDLTHYVVPDVGVVVDYLEILEDRELQGVVFTQTACQAVQHSKGRRYTHTKQAEHSHNVLINLGLFKCGKFSGSPFYCCPWSVMQDYFSTSKISGQLPWSRQSELNL